MAEKDKKDSEGSSHIFDVPMKAANQSLTLIVSSFGLIAALAWNEAIKALISKWFQADGTIISLFIYAVLVTLVAVGVTSRLQKYIDAKEDKA